MTAIRVHLVSLGCPKNLVDSEVFLGRICQDGFQITPEADDADVLMVNTCGFIDAAKEESIQSILDMCAYKQEDPAKRVVVVGCLGQRYPGELMKEIPEIDAIIGLAEYGRMSQILTELVGEARPPRVEVTTPNHPAYSEGSRLRLTPTHTTYLRTSEGCDNPCTFCSIPSFRGRFRSKSIEQLLDEARELVDSGATELNLISQDLTSYGVDLYNDYQLTRLLEQLNGLPGVRWIRLLYAYPYRFTNDMIDAVRDLDRVVNYVDMPVQHISDPMLRRMGRRMGKAGTMGLFSRMRERIPGLVLRTTFIVGFPGETDEDFEELVDFVEEFRIERVGVFTYSDEEGTPASRMKKSDKIPAAVAEARRDALMLAQQAVAFEWNERRVGTEIEVLADGYEEDDQGRTRLYARSFAEAPEIDSRIYLPDGVARPGEYLRVRVAETADYDLIAAPVTQPHAARR